jgi:hypothetical protein
MDMPYENWIQCMFYLKLLGESIIVIILMQEDAVHLPLFDFYFYDRFVRGCVPIKGPRLVARD